MIDHVSGTVKSIHNNIVIVDIGNISLALHTANPKLFPIEKKANLFTYMHWNQENGPTLFGFKTELEKKIFILVISCSGIGPKIGLAVLKDLGSELFLSAIQTDDEKILATVSGLGPKKVEQIIVQLKRKVSKLIKSGIKIQNSKTLINWQQVSDVLVSLKYSRTEVSKAMKFLSDTYSTTNTPFDGLVRQALSFLSKSR